MKTLRLQLRFLLPLGLLLFVAAYITVPLVDRLTLRWFLRDLDIRAQLVAETMTSAIANTPRATTSRARWCSASSPGLRESWTTP